MDFFPSHWRIENASAHFQYSFKTPPSKFEFAWLPRVAMATLGKSLIIVSRSGIHLLYKLMPVQSAKNTKHRNVRLVHQYDTQNDFKYHLTTQKSLAEASFGLRSDVFSAPSSAL